MPWAFANPAYHFKTGRSLLTQQAIKNIIEAGVKNRDSAHETARTLGRFGVSYRRKNMLDDISRAMSSEYSNTKGAYGRANAFYDRAEKIRKANPGMTRRQSVEVLEQIQDHRRQVTPEMVDEFGPESKDWDTSPEFWDPDDPTYDEYEH